jgi:predicted AlkP superfamily phosphohydrolase/phosphomutase
MNKPLHQLSRRSFIKCTAGGLAALGAMGCPAVGRSRGATRSVIVLGIDGMDPGLLEKYLSEGRMPNARKLIDRGCFSPLQTSNPPQSPTAWSNFISGTNPGGHGIYDFIARDPATLTPYFSGSRMEGVAPNVTIGGYRIPLTKRKLLNLRRGPTFWNDLEKHGVDCTLLRVPCNFPPVSSRAKTLSGLGTPDVHGSYGMFTFYTDKPDAVSRDVPGGRIESVQMTDHRIAARILGPVNSLSVEGENVDVPFEINVDPQQSAVDIAVQGKRFILREREWSDWIPVEFPMLPHLASMRGICKFYLQKARGDFSLYMTPVNIDPVNPSMPISTPGGYASELAAEMGRFYTQGMPEDTHVLSAGVFGDGEYRDLASRVLADELKLFEHEFNKFREGFFYHYFSTLDLNSHMFWRTLDTGHPLYTEKLAREQGDYMPSLYAKMDGLIGKAMERMDERTLLLVVSDHGFASFRRQFNLNTWLSQNGFATLSRGGGGAGFLSGIDWGRTQAYGLGINSLYLNLRGREAEGCVSAADKNAVIDRLIPMLKAVRDPKDGMPVISNVYRPSEIYSGPYVDAAPDLLVCYHLNYRASWDTILGGFPPDVILDNTNVWSGDHTMDAAFLPGVLMSNRPLTAPQPSLQDMAPSILSVFGAPRPEEMTGRNVFSA